MHPGLLGKGLIDCFVEDGTMSLNGSSSAIIMRSIIHSAVIPSRMQCVDHVLAAQTRYSSRRSQLELLLVRVSSRPVLQPSHRLGADKMSF